MKKATRVTDGLCRDGRRGLSRFPHRHNLNPPFLTIGRERRTPSRSDLKGAVDSVSAIWLADKQAVACKRVARCLEHAVRPFVAVTDQFFVLIVTEHLEPPCSRNLDSLNLSKTPLSVKRVYA